MQHTALNSPTVPQHGINFVTPKHGVVVLWLACYTDFLFRRVLGFAQVLAAP